MGPPFVPTSTVEVVAHGIKKQRPWEDVADRRPGRDRWFIQVSCIKQRDAGHPQYPLNVVVALLSLICSMQRSVACHAPAVH